VIKKPRTRGGYSPDRGLQNTSPQGGVAPVAEEEEEEEETDDDDDDDDDDEEEVRNLILNLFLIKLRIGA
jgi:hypothetical protein